jgi:hypothetical protein
MGKTKWQHEEVIGKRRVYARATRSEIIVRVENDGDTTKYAEYGYPKVFGLAAAAHQAAIETEDEEQWEKWFSEAGAALSGEQAKEA